MAGFGRLAFGVWRERGGEGGGREEGGDAWRLGFCGSGFCGVWLLGGGWRGEGFKKVKRDASPTGGEEKVVDRVGAILHDRSRYCSCER